MAELVAVGAQPQERWRQPIPEGRTIRLGRAPRTGWNVPWDPHISREHADLILTDGLLKVTCLGTARNPVVFKGQQVDQFNLAPGEEFHIGNTSFRLVDESAIPLVDERSFREEELSSIRLKQDSPWQEVFAQLPGLIAKSRSTEDFATLILDSMLRAMPHADAVAVMHYDVTTDAALDKPLMMRTAVRQDTIPFRPSRRLIRAALESGKYVLHVWSEPGGGSDAEYTMIGGLDWAFCAPVAERSCAGWCLYAAGCLGYGSSRKEQLTEDLRFTELLAHFVGAISQVRLLEHQAAEMSQFFSPAIINTLRQVNAADVLVPKESDITMLFCDVRGFSWRVERAKHELQEVFHRVSDALGVMTRNIMKHEGVIADFQGDAALAFWGWPHRLEEGPAPACRAALAMHDEFSRANESETHSLAGFQVGIGIGHGRAIAGRMGTQDQAKVGVFGPVVNLASRLEGMTKQFRAPIILDEPTAAYVRNDLSPTTARCRRLGRVRPKGMQTAVTVSELLHPEGYPGAITNQNIVDHEAAVDAFIAGHWMKAFDAFAGLPVADRAKDLLMWYMAQHEFVPPDDWDGVISLADK